ncbi:MAG: hypothetical protein IJ433_00785 [Ruminococcus sp.]|nr:hypothetical protein [Ruminococcus sp.]
MRKTKRSGSFLFCLVINMMLNLDGLIPAAILIALHFIFDISIWWGVGAIGLWILYLMVWMLIFGWASKASNEPAKPRENKNPYSSGPYVSIKNNNNKDGNI